jgi:hypothetical protein
MKIQEKKNKMRKNEYMSKEKGNIRKRKSM